MALLFPMGVGISLAKTRAPKPVVSVAALTQEVESLRSERYALARQVDWFKRQLFGGKSEKRIDVPGGQLGWCRARTRLSPQKPLPKTGVARSHAIMAV
ncbi:MAG: hypothetical protein ACI8PT_002782 [Gammaproteobacteria bacterium]|jgi:hypothetical protein